MNNNKIIEGYDDRHTNMSIQQCGDLCKTISGCYGFGYDPIQRICYPSKETLIGPPLDPNTLFRSEYNPNYVTCNKVDPIIVHTHTPPFDKRRMNSIFVCSERQGMQPQWYLHSRGRFRNIGEGANIDEIFDVDSYGVIDHDWTINKYNFNNIDLLVHDLNAKELNHHTVTNMDRIQARSVESQYPYRLRRPEFNIIWEKRPETDDLDLEQYPRNEYIFTTNNGKTVGVNPPTSITNTQNLREESRRNLVFYNSIK